MLWKGHKMCRYLLIFLYVLSCSSRNSKSEGPEIDQSNESNLISDWFPYEAKKPVSRQRKIEIEILCSTLAETTCEYIPGCWLNRAKKCEGRVLSLPLSLEKIVEKKEWQFGVGATLASKHFIDLLLNQDEILSLVKKYDVKDTSFLELDFRQNWLIKRIRNCFNDFNLNLADVRHVESYRICDLDKEEVSAFLRDSSQRESLLKNRFSYYLMYLYTRQPIKDFAKDNGISLAEIANSPLAINFTISKQQAVIGLMKNSELTKQDLLNLPFIQDHAFRNLYGYKKEYGSPEECLKISRPIFELKGILDLFKIKCNQLVGLDSYFFIHNVNKIKRVVDKYKFNFAAVANKIESSSYWDLNNIESLIKDYKVSPQTALDLAWLKKDSQLEDWSRNLLNEFNVKIPDILNFAKRYYGRDFFTDKEFVAKIKRTAQELDVSVKELLQFENLNIVVERIEAFKKAKYELNIPYQTLSESPLLDYVLSNIPNLRALIEIGVPYTECLSNYNCVFVLQNLSIFKRLLTLSPKEPGDTQWLFHHFVGEISFLNLMEETMKKYPGVFGWREFIAREGFYKNGSLASLDQIREKVAFRLVFLGQAANLKRLFNSKELIFDKPLIESIYSSIAIMPIFVAKKLGYEDIVNFLGDSKGRRFTSSRIKQPNETISPPKEDICLDESMFEDFYERCNVHEPSLLLKQQEGILIENQDDFWQRTGMGKIKIDSKEKDIQNAFKGYQKDDYADMRSYTQKNQQKAFPFADIDGRWGAEINAMNYAILLAPKAKNDITVYRGQKFCEKHANIEEPYSFSSTSLSALFSYKWILSIRDNYEKTEEGSCLLEIHIPAGFPAVFLNIMAEYRKEHEFLLPSHVLNERGEFVSVQYKIKEKKTKEFSTTFLYEATQGEVVNFSSPVYVIEPIGALTYLPVSGESFETYQRHYAQLVCQNKSTDYVKFPYLEQICQRATEFYKK